MHPLSTHKHKYPIDHLQKDSGYREHLQREILYTAPIEHPDTQTLYKAPIQHLQKTPIDMITLQSTRATPTENPSTYRAPTEHTYGEVQDLESTHKATAPTDPYGNHPQETPTEHT